MNVHRLILPRVLTALIAVLLAGCASMGLGGSPEEIVLKRAQARLDAMVERDYVAAYKFLTPAYRAVVPEKRYANQFLGPAQWESAKALSAKCEEKRCIVRVQVNVRLFLKGHMDRVDQTHFDETWVLEEGIWYKFETL